MTLREVTMQDRLLVTAHVETLAMSDPTLRVIADTVIDCVRCCDYFPECSHVVDEEGVAARSREMTPWEVAWAVVQWARQQEPKGEPLRPVEIGLSHLEAVVDLYRQRRALGQWLRVRLQHEATLRERYESIIKHSPDPVAGIFTQLAADIDHSSLLLRLLKGKEPLPEPPPLSHAYPVYPDE